ncbi:MAG: hypothetical protein K2X47_04830 [Bdellovibrionales bacterium]|nr:hypothetical protein [Bdellovibrionales bacterium]
MDFSFLKILVLLTGLSIGSVCLGDDYQSLVIFGNLAGLEVGAPGVEDGVKLLSGENPKVLYLRDGPESLDLLKKGIVQFFNRASDSGGKTFHITFLGHGLPGCFQAPIGAKIPHDRFFSSIADAVEEANFAQPPKLIFTIDSCYSGSAAVQIKAMIGRIKASGDVMVRTAVDAYTEAKLDIKAPLVGVLTTELLDHIIFEILQKASVSPDPLLWWSLYSQAAKSYMQWVAKAKNGLSGPMLFSSDIESGSLTSSERVRLLQVLDSYSFDPSFIPTSHHGLFEQLLPDLKVQCSNLAIGSGT